MKNPLAYGPSEEFKEGKCTFSKGINENVIRPSIDGEILAVEILRISKILEKGY